MKFMRAALLLAISSVCFSNGTTVANGQSIDELPASAQALLNQFDGVRVHWTESRARAFYGTGMTEGTTPDDAAQNWMNEYHGAFGVPGVDLRLMRRHQITHRGLTIFVYRQFMEGLPVEGSRGSIFVRAGSPNRVVYAAAFLFDPPDAGFPVQALDGPTVLQAISQSPGQESLTEWTDPELVVFPEGLSGSPVRVWKISGRDPDPASDDMFTFYIDASDGNVVHVQNDLYDAATVEGTVTGKASSGTLPDLVYNAPSEQPVPGVRVRELPAGAPGYTDNNGDYIITTAAGLIDVGADFDGQWVTIIDCKGQDPCANAAPLSETIEDVNASATGIDFLFNATPTEFDTAQVNCMIHGKLVHDFFVDRAPCEYGGVGEGCAGHANFVLTCIVNRSGTGCGGGGGGEQVKLLLRALKVEHRERPVLLKSGGPRITRCSTHSAPGSKSIPPLGIKLYPCCNLPKHGILLDHCARIRSYDSSQIGARSTSSRVRGRIRRHDRDLALRRSARRPRHVRTGKTRKRYRQSR